MVVTPTPTISSEVEIKPAPTQEIATEEVVEVEKTTYRVTAYCSCEKCCGVWATKRPLDENGNQIVYGASGEVLAPGISCASTLPFGTEVELDGFGIVIVEDRIAQWVVDKYGENLIDIYFSDHQIAWEFGEKYLEGVVLEW